MGGNQKVVGRDKLLVKRREAANFPFSHEIPPGTPGDWIVS